MDRDLTEKIIVKKLMEILSVYKEYNPNGERLCVSVSDTCIFASNQWWSEDKDKPLDVFLDKYGYRSREHYEDEEGNII